MEDVEMIENELLSTEEFSLIKRFIIADLDKILEAKTLDEAQVLAKELYFKINGK